MLSEAVDHFTGANSISLELSGTFNSRGNPSVYQRVCELIGFQGELTNSVDCIQAAPNFYELRAAWAEEVGNVDPVLTIELCICVSTDVQVPHLTQHVLSVCHNTRKRRRWLAIRTGMSHDVPYRFKHSRRS